MMGLEITLPRCTSRSWFTAGESVCGTVHWTAKRSTIVSKLTVHLEGGAYSTVGLRMDE